MHSCFDKDVLSDIHQNKAISAIANYTALHEMDFQHDV